MSFRQRNNFERFWVLLKRWRLALWHRFSVVVVVVVLVVVVVVKAYNFVRGAVFLLI